MFCLMTVATIHPKIEGLPSCLLCEEYKNEAGRIQSSLLPARDLTATGVEVAFRYEPYAEVGGDFADFFVLMDGVIGLSVGDVVGKGLPGAMYAALVMGTLRGIHKTGVDPASVLGLLNNRLLVRPVAGRFCATLYACFNPVTKQLSFSNAGLPFPLLLSNTGCRFLGQGGLPAGMFPKTIYDLHTVQLLEGDVVLFATDGLHELCNSQGMEFSAQRLTQIWSQCGEVSAAQALESVFDALGAFSDTGQQDDITAVVLKVTAAP